MNKLNSKVAVLMSVFGYENFIEDSIVSILNQTFSDFLFIIVDDGCSYDLGRVIASFKDKRIFYLKNNENLGLTKSLNKGIEISKSDYIVRQDAGNISLPARIKTQLDFLEKNTDYYLVGSSVVLIDENGNEICTENVSKDTNIIIQKMPEYNCIYHSTIMFRNDGRYKYREKFIYSQDYDFYLRLLSDSVKFGNISDILLKERLIKSSITHEKRQEQEFYKNLARKFYFERLKFGKDRYEDFDQSYLPEVKSGKNRSKTTYISFYRQKAYLLFYSFRFEELRKVFRSYYSKYGFDIKLFLYYLLSFFPFMARALKRKKGINVS